jgi:protein SCO1/2
MRLDEALKEAGEKARDVSARARERARGLDLRVVSRLSVIAAIVVIALVAAVYGIIKATSGSATLSGTDLGGTPAPGFTLTDQNGATVSLQQLRGRPVALAFMYTHCPDVCPLTAEKMRQAAQVLGDRANAVVWLGVSVDPAGDTPDAAKQFAATHGLAGRLRFLMGTRAQLLPVWKAYFLVADESANTPANQVADHTGAVYLIDKQGRERVYLDSAFDPVKQLAPDLRSLLGA